MVAFGGAAPLHAARLLEKLNLAYVVIPQDAGVGSAIGFLNAPISYEVVRSSHMLLESYDSTLVSKVLESMREEASNVVASVSSDGDFIERGTAYMRYVGQGHEISVAFDPSSIDRDQLLKMFETTYTSLNGRVIPGAPVEVMSWTLNVSVVPDIAIDFPSCATVVSELTDSKASDSVESLKNEGGVTLLQREELESDQLVCGPALITERHTTTVVPAGFRLRRLQSDHLLMFKEV
jgi:N-methylhydantoinase A